MILHHHRSDALGLTLSWWRSLSYRNQSIELLCKSMDWGLYDRDHRYERVKASWKLCLNLCFRKWLRTQVQPGKEFNAFRTVSVVHTIWGWSWKFQNYILKSTISKSSANIFNYHCVKSVRIRSYSGQHFPALGLNTERYGVSSEYGPFLTNVPILHPLK